MTVFDQIVEMEMEMKMKIRMKMKMKTKTKVKIKIKYQIMRCYYPHRSRDSVSPVSGIFFIITHGTDKKTLEPNPILFIARNLTLVGNFLLYLLAFSNPRI